MFPPEYEIFLKTGATPVGTRPCILCCRYLLVDYVLMCRELLMLGRQGNIVPCEDQPWTMKETQIMQIYYNSMDVINGYYNQYCIIPNAREPLIQPLVQLNRLSLKGYKFKNRWMIDQSAIVWKAPSAPVPLLGESVQRF